MDALELLRSRNRFEEKLPSGLTVTLRLPRIRDCILAGQVPLPVLEHVLEAAVSGDASAVSLEEAGQMARFKDEIVRRSVVAIEGQAIQLDLADLIEFSEKDYEHIVSLAIRETTPKAEVLT